MKYILNEDDHEPAMRYEGIARYAYDCERFGDPNATADASFFDGEFIPTLTHEGLNAMYGIIDQLIIKEGHSQYKKTELQTVKDSLAIGMEQDNSIELLDYIIVILKDEQ
jgi:hypothetical protein